MHQPLFCLARIDIRFAKALTKLSLAARDPAFAAWQVEMESPQEDMCNGFVADSLCQQTGLKWKAVTEFEKSSTVESSN
jgi:hypothetical protein